MTVKTLISLMSTEPQLPKRKNMLLDFKSTDLDKTKLCKEGITYLPSIVSFKQATRHFEPKAIMTSQYFGRVIDKKQIVMADVKTSDFVDISLFSFDARDALIKLVTHWMVEGEPETTERKIKSRANALLKKGFAKKTYQNTIEPIRKDIMAIIGLHPEIIDFLKKSEEFQHIDAFQYGLYVNGEMIEVVTVYSDQFFMYKSPNSDAIAASISGGHDIELRIPSSIRTTDPEKRLYEAPSEDTRKSA